MGSAQSLLLRELDSHFFHGSGAALAGVPRTAHFRQRSPRRQRHDVVATELGRRVEPSAWLWPAALRARPSCQQCSSEQQQPCRASHCHAN